MSLFLCVPEGEKKTRWLFYTLSVLIPSTSYQMLGASRTRSLHRKERERNTRTHKRQQLSLRKMKPDVESHHLHGTVSPPFSTKEQGRETKTKTEIKKGHTTSRAVTIFPFSLFFFFLCFLCSSSTT